MKRIYRISKGKVLAGVCGGISEYLNIDPSIVRIIAVLAGFAMFPWVPIAYIAAAIFIPEKKEGFDGFGTEDYEDDPYTRVNDDRTEYKPFIDSKKTQLVFGGSIVVIGILLLLKNISSIFGWIDFGTIFAIGMIGAGLYVLYGRRN